MSRRIHLTFFITAAALLFKTTAFAAEPVTQPALPPLDDTSRIRVGLVVSKLTADEFINGKDGRTWGYERNTRTLPELKSPDVDVYPIVEPGSENDPQLLAALKVSFPEKPIVVGDRLDDLNRLDVIVASFVLYVPPTELAALDQAVSSGRGLIIRQFMGLRSPGRDDKTLQALCGVTSAHFFNSRGNELMKCKVIAPHPILGNLAIGAELSFYPNGLCGDYVGSPLVEVIDPQKHADLPDLPHGKRYCPIFVSEHGRGNVVYCAFKGDKPLPPELQAAGDDPFTIRTIKWLAEQSRTAAASATTAPAKP